MSYSNTFRPALIKKHIIQVIRRLGLPGLAIALLIVLLICSQTERFIYHGTILGYRVRNVQKTVSLPSNNLFGGQSGNQKKLACEKVTQSDVSKLLGEEVREGTSFLPDRTTPNIVSNCIYRTVSDAKSPVRTASILYRETVDINSSKQSITNLQKQGRGADISGVGDQAYYIDSANQLTVRKDKKIVTVTVTKANIGQPASKDVAIKLAVQALK